MKLIATAKLLATPAQRASLLAMVERFNAACDWLAAAAFAAGSRQKYEMQRAFYSELRERFGLSAQMAVRAISKVADAYKVSKQAPRFKPRGAVPYDQRILSFKADDRVSLLTLDGRIVVPFVTGDHHGARLRAALSRGQADLVLRRGHWYLQISVTVADVPERVASDWLGVDLGICNLATDSDGERHSGATVEATRARLLKLRGSLQSAGTKSAKRHLKRLAGREARFRSHTNHVISKRLVTKAKDTGRGIAMEDLRGIRSRTTVRRAQRAQFGSWAFHQLREFVTYKSALAGVPLRVVDPRDTSRTCPECGYCDRHNRRSQSEFVCKSCGYAAHADCVGARNAARRAAVNGPIVSVVETGNRNKHRIPRGDQGQSPGL